MIRAEGESEAAHLISDALAKCGTGLIEVRRIDVRIARDSSCFVISGPWLAVPTSSHGSVFHHFNSR